MRCPKVSKGGFQCRWHAGAEHHSGSHIITAHLNIEGAVHTWHFVGIYRHSTPTREAPYLTDSVNKSFVADC